MLLAECAGSTRIPTRDHPVTEGVEELGGGFRRVGLAEFMTGAFESIYHGDYLYFHDRRVSYYASSSLSPSRAFAAYADTDFQSEWRDDQYGFQVYIFRAADQQVSRVTTRPLYYQGEFRWDWHEPEHHVVLHFKDGRASQFQLPPARPNQAMQRTAGRSAFSLSMTSTFNLLQRAPSPAVADLVSR